MRRLFAGVLFLGVLCVGQPAQALTTAICFYNNGFVYRQVHINSITPSIQGAEVTIALAGATALYNQFLIVGTPIVFRAQQVQRCMYVNPY